MSGGEGSIVQFDNVGLRYGTEREVPEASKDVIADALWDAVVDILTRAVPPTPSSGAP